MSANTNSLNNCKKCITLISDTEERYEAVDGRLTVENDSPTFDVGDGKRRHQWHDVTKHDDSVGKDQKQMWLRMCGRN